MRSILGLILLAGVASAGLSPVALAKGDDWPAWRGPAGTGITAEKSAPTTWAQDKNIKWKAALPQPGNGSPIVSNGRVFVTCAEDGEGARRSLYCFDRKDGKQLWVRTVEFGKKTPTHDTNGYCPTTPAADGERVVVWEGPAGLHCYDFEGKKLWSRDLGDFRHMWGEGTSPVIHDGKVFLNCGPGKRVFVAALDVKTGTTLWETEEFKREKSDKNEGGGNMGSWSTPVITRIGGRETLLCTLPDRLVAYDPADGKVLWWSGGLRHTVNKAPQDLAYSSPVVAGDLCIVVAGFGGPGLAVRVDGKGDVSESHRAWRYDKGPQSIGSGVFLDGHVYVPYETEIRCIDPLTGKAAWREPARGSQGYWSSITFAAGRCYVTNKQGATVVFKPQPQKFELVAVNALNEPSNSTPAISGGEIFIRTFKNLYCIAE